jgi:ATPase subunit of ABC transporter with duplicated ATPase domains
MSNLDFLREPANTEARSKAVEKRTRGTSPGVKFLLGSFLFSGIVAAIAIGSHQYITQRNLEREEEARDLAKEARQNEELRAKAQKKREEADQKEREAMAAKKREEAEEAREKAREEAQKKLDEERARDENARRQIESLERDRANFSRIEASRDGDGSSIEEVLDLLGRSDRSSVFDPGSEGDLYKTFVWQNNLRVIIIETKLFATWKMTQRNPRRMKAGYRVISKSWSDR